MYSSYKKEMKTVLISTNVYYKIASLQAFNVGQHSIHNWVEIGKT